MPDLLDIAAVLDAVRGYALVEEAAEDAMDSSLADFVDRRRQEYC